jgi:hypothetical protein
MPVTWTVEDGAIVVAPVGEYSSEELERAVSSALYSPDFPLGGPILFDGRESAIPPSATLVERRASLIRALLGHGVIGRCALVPADHHRQFAGEVLSSMPEANGNVEIFGSIAEGRAWIGASG